MEDNTKTLWFIGCRTGCTCCCYENFIHGPYTSLEDAESQKKDWLERKNNPIASQYARYGSYHVFDREAEFISGDRLIVGEHVFCDDGFPSRLLTGESYELD